MYLNYRQCSPLKSLSKSLHGVHLAIRLVLDLHDFRKGPLSELCCHPKLCLIPMEGLVHELLIYFREQPQIGKGAAKEVSPSSLGGSMMFNSASLAIVQKMLFIIYVYSQQKHQL